MKRLAMMAGPGLALLFAALTHAAGLAPEAQWTAAITVWCAVWWIFEPLPIPITSLLPFILLPVAGVLDHKQVAAAYGHHLILLLLGGFILSTAMEKSGAHRRVALWIVRLVGGHSGPRVILGFMLSSAFLSMWISNTATTLMLLPVALAVIQERDEPGFSFALLVGLAWSASIGGMGTPVGTPPNVVFLGLYKESTGIDISFAQWMGLALPVVFVLLPMAWWWVTRSLPSGEPLSLPDPGAWRRPETRVLILFALTALAWVTRSEPMGGWSALLGLKGIGDSTVALAAVVLLFTLPDGEGERLLDWETANRIPWGLLLLFGGGIALARGFKASGLSEALGHGLSGLASWPVFAMMLVLCLAVTFATEVTSNTATTTVLLPILAAAAVAASVDHRLFMIPATLSASCAFMLPVATAPNAIVFGTDQVPIRSMAKAGVVLNLIGAMVIAGLMVLLL
ncbi:MAG: SLC13 family permease [Myxococcota bacterium]|nr:SLC13 family permease [Myxococcota bacterium]